MQNAEPLFDKIYIAVIQSHFSQDSALEMNK